MRQLQNNSRQVGRRENKAAVTAGMAFMSKPGSALSTQLRTEKTRMIEPSLKDKLIADQNRINDLRHKASNPQFELISDIQAEGGDFSMKTGFPDPPMISDPQTYQPQLEPPQSPGNTYNLAAIRKKLEKQANEDAQFIKD